VGLEQHLTLFFTGFQRTASEIAKEQIERTSDKQIELQRMRELVDEAERLLTNKSAALEEFGKLLHEQWRIKRSMSSRITSPDIDRIYETGLKAGASGGKLLGAGGGGFMMFLVEPGRQAIMRETLGKLLYVPIRFDHIGSQIVYFSKDDYY